MKTSPESEDQEQILFNEEIIKIFDSMDVLSIHKLVKEILLMKSRLKTEHSEKKESISDKYQELSVIKIKEDNLFKICHVTQLNQMHCSSHSSLFGYSISSFRKKDLIKLAILFQVSGGMLGAVGSAVTLGTPLHISNSFAEAATRAAIALCFYGPAYLLAIYALLFSYISRFSPLAGRALGNMVYGVFMAFLYSVFGLEALDKNIVAGMVISLVFGLISISYALWMQYQASALQLTRQEVEYFKRFLQSNNFLLLRIGETDTLNQCSPQPVEITPNETTQDSTKACSFLPKLILTSIFVGGGVVCTVIGFSLQNKMASSFVLQIAGAFFRALYQTLPSSLDLSQYSELIQLCIRAFIAGILGVPEFYDTLIAIQKAQSGGSVIASTAVGNLPGEVFAAGLAYKWLGENVDVPLQLTILSAAVSFITQLSLVYA